MKSYTQLRTDYGAATLDDSSVNLTQGTTWMNDDIRRICALGDFPFMHKDRTITTVASQQEYALPYDMETVTSVKVTIGTRIYSPSPVNNQREWDILNSGQYTSDTPERFFVKDGELALWPTPSSSSNTITLNGKLRIKDLNTADITSTTITTLAAGGTALTVSAGLTVQMVGFWIRPTFSTTANTGDGNWYELAGVTNATTATLARKYGGLAIAAGSAACTISQMPILPEPFHDWPVYLAAERYWALAGNPVKSAYFKQLATEKRDEFMSTYKTNITDPVIDDGNDLYDYMQNPNLSPTGLSG